MRPLAAAVLALVAFGCSHSAPAPAPATAAAPVRVDAGVATPTLAYPVARTVDVVDDYHGTRVADPYRWLEDPTSPGYEEWIAAENALTERFLSTIPDREPLRKRLTELWDYERFGVPLREGNQIFFERNSGLQNQSVLYLNDAPRFEPRELLDPNTLSKDGTIALSGVVPSRDGALLAYGLAVAGSDWNEWHVRDVKTGKDLPERIQWVKFSDVSWTPDGKGFFYSRYDEPQSGTQLRDVNYFQKLYHHKLGTPQSEDVLVYERKDQKEWSFGSEVSDDGRWLVVRVGQGTDQRNRVYIADLKSKVRTPQPLIDVLEARYDFIGSQGPVLWFLTNLDAPKGRVIAIDLRHRDHKHWKTLIPESEDRLKSAAAVGGRFVLNYLKDAHSDIRIHRLDGSLQEALRLPVVGNATGLEGRLAQKETYFSFETFSAPPAIFRLEPATGEFRIFRAPQLKFEPSEYESRQIFYRSKDGTRVPMTLTFRKGTTPDGNRPVLLYGYGGFDIPLVPKFSPALAGMDGAGGRAGHGQHPGRGRVRRGLAPGGDEAAEAERVRRLHRRGRVVDLREVDAAVAAGDRGRFERWAAGGRGAEPASGSFRVRASVRGGDGHASLPEVHHRLGLDLGLRVLGRSGAVPCAARLLTASEHQSGGHLSGDPGDHRRPR